MAAVRASDSVTAAQVGLDAMSLAWPAFVQLVFFFFWLAVFVGLAKITLPGFIVINLILCFHYDAEIELGNHLMSMGGKLFMYFCIKNYIGTQAGDL